MYVPLLELNNFKKARRARYEFSRVNVLAGGNDQGKSNVIEALDELIFAGLEDNQADCVTWKELRSRMYMEFRHQNYSGKLEEKLIKSKIDSPTARKEKMLIINDGINPEIEILSVDEATKAFNKIVNADLSRYSGISMQESSRDVLKPEDGDRARRLRKITGTDRTERMAARAKDIVKELETKIEDLRREADVLTNSHVEHMIVPEEIPVAPLELRVNTIRDNLTKMRERLTILREKENTYKNWEDTQKDIKDLEDDVSNRKTEIEKKKSEVAETQAVAIDEEAYKKLISDIEALRIEVQNEELAQAKRDPLKKTLESLTKKIADVKIRIDSLMKYAAPELAPEDSTLYQKELDELSISLDEIVVKVSDKESKVKAAQKSLDLAKAGKCHECEQPFHGDVIALESDLSLKTEEFVEVKKSERAARIKKSELETKIRILNDAKNLFTKDQADLNNANQILQDYEKDLLANTKSLIDLSSIKDLTKLRESLQTLVMNKQIVEENMAIFRDSEKRNDVKRTEIQVLESSNLKDLEKIVELRKIIEPPFPEEKSETLDKEIVSVQFDFDLYSGKISQAIERQESINKVIEHNKKLDEQRTEQLQKATSNRAEADDLSKDLSAMIEAQKKVQESMAPYMLETGMRKIVKLMNSFSQDIFPQYDIDFRRIKRGMDFIYQDRKIGVWSPVSTASGFIRQSIAIAFRVSLCRLQGLGIFMGDEGDSDGETINSIKLYTRLLSEPFEQFFLITHRNETVELLRNEFNARIFHIRNGEIINVEN